MMAACHLMSVFNTYEFTMEFSTEIGTSWHFKIHRDSVTELKKVEKQAYGSWKITFCNIQE